MINVIPLLLLLRLCVGVEDIQGQLWLLQWSKAPYLSPHLRNILLKNSPRIINYYSCSCSGRKEEWQSDQNDTKISDSLNHSETTQSSHSERWPLLLHSSLPYNRWNQNSHYSPESFLSCGQIAQVKISLFFQVLMKHLSIKKHKLFFNNLLKK